MALVVLHMPTSKPNFFILGAPKCGTTSLAAWLREHPQVFMSDPKEPWFFNTDVLFRSTKTLSAYEAIFESAQPPHVAIGEASTCYLYSREAVTNILAYSPNARFIIMLRKPQEMAVSLHAQECINAEDVRDFETAWRLQPERAMGRKLPKSCEAPDTYQYGERCRVGTQLSRVIDLVPNDRLLIIFLEDIRHDPAGEFDKILRFLRVSTFRPPEFRPENSRWRVRSMAFKRILNALGKIKHRLGLRWSTGLQTKLFDFNTTPESAPQPVSPQMQSELAAYFRDEIATVQRLTGRVPVEWLS